MKYLGLLLMLVITVVVIFNAVVIDYDYSNTIESYWQLSDKASTLQQKADYLDKYVTAIEQAGLSGNNAVFLKTPDNSYEQNMIALKSLQGRLHQIGKMDEQSFAYQTAIQQITAQEQGEATQLTSTFEGLWYLKNHSFYWDWHELLLLIAIITGWVVAISIAVWDTF